MVNSIECVVNSDINWVEIVNVLIATINVGAVILFFIFERNRQKKDKINDYNLSWYKLINISERTKILNDIVNDEISKLEALKNNDETDLNKRKSESQSLIVDFTKKIINEKNIISPIMKCIDEDSNKEISKKFNDLRELHDTCLINSALLNNKVIDYSDFINLKNSIIETYYNIGKQYLK